MAEAGAPSRQPSSPTAPPASSTAPAALAKAALRRLAQARQEPTPEAFSRAYAAEARVAGTSAPVLPPAGQDLVRRLAGRVPGLADGDAEALAAAAAAGDWEAATGRLAASGDAGSGAALAQLIERVLRGVERGGRHWTTARRKESLQRVLSSSRQDAQRLQSRLAQLLGSWDHDTPDAETELADGAASPAAVPTAEPSATAAVAEPARPAGAPAPHDGADAGTGRPVIDLAPWQSMHARLGSSVRAALPTAVAEPSGGVEAAPPAAAEARPGEPGTARIDPLGERLARLQARVLGEGASPADVAALAALCDEADRVIAHRQRLLDQLGGLVHELTGSLGELAEDDSWARGQCAAMQAALDHGLSSRTVRSVSELLRTTRERQQGLRAERDRARDALKGLIQRMLSELGELGSQTGRFHESVGRYAGVIERADSLESLAGVVREMVEESRTVASLVGQTQQRLHDEHRRATELSDRVSELESELRRLSAEVATDPLTQVANRRGLMSEFETERARHQREGLTLSVGLIDIDNFKRLNDELGHAAGDVALKSLAAAVRDTLRPTDRVARFGGEEFVVLLPATSAEEAQQVLTRVQRTLSGALFLHESRPIFVTFSAGVTAYREGEALDAALERADVALYEAKRTGKNRTCVA